MCQCHGKLKKEIVWNKVKFATYPSVWPAIVPEHFFLFHVNLLPCSPVFLSFCIYFTDVLYLACLVKQLSRSFTLCTKFSSYSFGHAFNHLQKTPAYMTTKDCYLQMCYSLRHACLQACKHRYHSCSRKGERDVN